MIARAGLFVSLLIATLVRLPHLRFVPIWDGRTYWDDCAQRALSNAFDPLAFNCFGHRSMLYMLTVLWPQYFSYGSALLLNLAHLAVSLLTIWAFYRVMMRLQPGPAAGLATIVFACMPAWTASSLNLNPDTGVLAAFLFALGYILERRLLAATIAGMFLVLSKEMGLLLWLVLAVLETGFALYESERGQRMRALLRRAGFLVPVVAYVVVGAALKAKELPATWGGAAPPASLIRTFLTFHLFDPIFGAYVADLFVINFSWVMTVVIAAWLIAICRALFRRRPLPMPRDVDRHRGIIAALAALATFYLLTRYPTFNNPRYLLAAFPMVVLLFAAATVSIVRKPWLQAAVFLIAAALQLASMWRTVDPMSKLAYDTFQVGEHELLSMTSRTYECCGHGRDQLVYNLQFTAFHYLQDALFSTIRPDNGDVIGMTVAANWYVIGPLDAQTRRRTLDKHGAVRLRILTLDDIGKKKPEELPERIRFVSYPNVNNARDLRLLSIGYRVDGPFSVQWHGYQLDYYDLTRLHLYGPPPL